MLRPGAFVVLTALAAFALSSAAMAEKETLIELKTLAQVEVEVVVMRSPFELSVGQARMNARGILRIASTGTT